MNNFTEEQQSKANIPKFQRDKQTGRVVWFAIMPRKERRREHEVREQTKIVINLNFRENTNLL